MNPKTIEKFIKDAVFVHKDKYDYSLVKYINSNTKIKIICKKHGIFEQTPMNHLSGTECKLCYNERRKGIKLSLGIDGFIAQAKKVHGDKYDYSKVKYINSKTKIEIYCPIHGSFNQTPCTHSLGSGCPLCGKKKTITSTSSNIEDFVKKAKKIYGDKYDYSKSKYITSKTKLIIICPKIGHGKFLQNPNNHLNKHGCPKCVRMNTKEDFIESALRIKKHIDKNYDYSKVEYVNSNIKVIISCKEHGDFLQTPQQHLSGHGCQKCGIKSIGKSRLFTNDDFIKKAQYKHKDELKNSPLYDYSKTEYINSRTKLNIICPVLNHGEFKQSPSSHLQGFGCPKCRLSKGEREINKLLSNNGIFFETQKKFNDCLNPKTNKKLPFDFYIPILNTCVEYDGEIHFIPIKCWDGEIGLINTKERDKIKTKYCEENNIKLIRIKYTEDVSKILTQNIKFLTKFHSLPIKF